MHLSDCFLELFTFIRYVADSPEMAGVEYATVSKDVALLINRLDQRVRQSGATPEQFDSARFAVFAWADEAVLCSSWTGVREWLKRPLQREYYGTSSAGEEFFERLDGLLGGGKETGAENLLAEFVKDSDLEAKAENGNAEVLEVYTLCLALGYTGMYFSESDQGRLGTLRQDCIRRIVGKQGGSLSAFPQAYGSGKGARPIAGYGRVFDPLSILFFLLPVLVVTGMYFVYRGLLEYSLSLWFG